MVGGGLSLCPAFGTMTLMFSRGADAAAGGVLAFARTRTGIVGGASIVGEQGDNGVAHVFSLCPRSFIDDRDKRRIQEFGPDLALFFPRF